MLYGQTLIDRAAKKGYSRYALHKALGVAQSHLSKIAHGGPISPVLALRIAECIGDDARTAALLAVADQADPDERAHVLRALHLPDTENR